MTRLRNLPAKVQETPLTFTFEQPGEWQAMHAAERFLQCLGFSVGRNQSGSPRGILFGDFDIQKWKNLRPADREALHGQMTGRGREGPIVIRFEPSMPAEALAALADASSTPIPQGERHGC